MRLRQQLPGVTPLELSTGMKARHQINAGLFYYLVMLRRLRCCPLERYRPFDSGSQRDDGTARRATARRRCPIMIGQFGLRQENPDEPSVVPTAHREIGRTVPSTDRRLRLVWQSSFQQISNRRIGRIGASQSPDNLDFHWRSGSELCDPCRSRHSIIDDQHAIQTFIHDQRRHPG